LANQNQRFPYIIFLAKFQQILFFLQKIPKFTAENIPFPQNRDEKHTSYHIGYQLFCKSKRPKPNGGWQQY
jgi:hypothetical protein